jgi:hypothetical protein
MEFFSIPRTRRSRSRDWVGEDRRCIICIYCVLFAVEMTGGFGRRWQTQYPGIRHRGRGKHENLEVVRASSDIRNGHLTNTSQEI